MTDAERPEAMASSSPAAIWLEAAAASLSADPLRKSPDNSGRLRFLGYDDGDAGAAPGRAKMLRAAASFGRLFRLPAPDAPGLVFFGAEADPASLGPHNAGLSLIGFAGSGLDARGAFESCVGEGIEYLSQFVQPDDPLASGTLGEYAGTLDPATRGFIEAVFSTCGVSVGHAVNWIQMRRLSDEATCWYPADLCLRRAAADFVPPLKLSTGCAAGATRADATLRGMLELIERDALALWWRGGRRARAIAADTEAGDAAATLLTQLRCGRGERQTQLLDITTDLGVPVVAAFSTRPDGYGFALGIGSRTSLMAAARSAIFEMCQSELSLHVIAAKRAQSGEAALNESDLRQHARAMLLDTRQCLLLQPDRTPAAEPFDVNIETIVERLTERDIVAYSIDLTRPRFGVPVVRVIAPGLQNEPCKIDTERLARVIAETGGGAQYTDGIALL
jgi:ribosomal protein S12 methylthiotransferase accessory factor